MAHSHCNGPGQGQGPGNNGFLYCSISLFSIVPISFPVPVLVPDSVHKPLQWNENRSRRAQLKSTNVKKLHVNCSLSACVMERDYFSFCLLFFLFTISTRDDNTHPKTMNPTPVASIQFLFPGCIFLKNVY